MSTLFSETTHESCGAGVLSVSDLTSRLRDLVEDRVGDVRVEGELVDFTRAASGHCYFKLQDDDAKISCVMWCWQAERLAFTPEDGMLLHAEGEVSLYEKRGDLQIKVEALEVAGEGALQKAFERLRRKLSGEGLFDDDHKKPLPRFPKVVGVVTSGSGAALHDICSGIERRFPAARLLLRPVSVQGDGAGEQIAEAVRFFGERTADPPVDVLVVGRGGGSVEALWAFNEEPVARALFDCEIPVVSAVGHETDYSISDFVCDRRAATPTMAAELVVPARRDLLARIRENRQRLYQQIQRRVLDAQQHLDHLRSAYGFRRPAALASDARDRLDALRKRLQRAAGQQMARQRERLSSAESRLHLLDPRRPLDQGYAKVERDGSAVPDADQLAAGDDVRLRFRDGERRARIES
jgi:exodeoxyribonuclease VII large subunit